MAKAVEPVEKVLNVTETKQQFSKLINEVARGESHVLVEKSGAPVAAIISPRELAQYRTLKERDEMERARLHESFSEFSRRFADVPDDELERVLEEARREYRVQTDKEHGRA